MSQHLVLKADEDLLHVVLCLPSYEHAELGGLDLPVSLVHARKIDSGGEADLGGLHGVVRAALDRQEVDTVVVIRVCGTDDGAIPVSEALVVTYQVNSTDVYL